MSDTLNSQRIILSADSTCDLDEELKERYHVKYFPLHINLNGKDYLDNVTITPEEIYQEYYDHKVLPKTAAVNVQEYIEHFRPWVEDGYEVIHVNLGHALSSSYQNCCLAAQELGHVHVVDSCNLSTGTGLTVVAAGKLIEKGLDAETIAERLRAGTSRRHASFILDTLTFLSAGGRCSSVTAFGANMLKLKPCIQVDNRDGSMAVGKKYRGSLDKVLVKYVKDELARYPDVNTDLLFITHSGIPQDYIDLVKKTVEDTITFKEIHITKASCTISCHCGPNTLGILFETDSPAL
ncbi:MAG TPA: DegV family protein [Candidatus Mediterraneibacter faecavium]|uniref:DegV family protein n=1 Tax=Candidatus Mediterraneibacter faecavium TaxID=2838668 RepID=A0A9D2TNA9_9FIRM|nr:DegV family protein [Candidatus Mediterraneibacter faecavium]